MCGEGDLRLDDFLVLTKYLEGLLEDLA